MKLEVDFKEAAKEVGSKLSFWSEARDSNPFWNDYKNFYTTVDKELTTISNEMKRPLSYSVKCIVSTYGGIKCHKKGEIFPGTCGNCSGFNEEFSGLPWRVRSKKCHEIKNVAAENMKVYQNYMRKKELTDFITSDI